MNGKIVLLGNAGSGKTSIILRYVSDSVMESYSPTLGASYISKDVSIDGQSLKLSIWDTAGSENYRSLTPMYYRNADAAIIVYDVTDTQSFNSVRSWLNDINEVTQINTIMICANKIDLIESRAVETCEGSELAEYLGLLYGETSAKNGTGVKHIFESIIRHMLQGQLVERNERSGSGEVQVLNKQETNGCCA